MSEHLLGNGSHNNVDASHLSWSDQSFSSFNGSVSSMSTTKDSPHSSNRNSGSSTDSGRGVSTVQLDAKNGPSCHITPNPHRLSDQSYESGVSSRRSFHSTSSSSRGSLDRLEESGYVSPVVSVVELFQAGWKDEDVMLAWLRGLQFDDYYSNFRQAGYDMPTVSRMTPEDLTAIGVTKPAHRKRLKSEIGRLQISDGIPDFRPNDLYEWLHLLRLDTYYNTLSNQGYSDIDQVTDITWEDLEDIGIKMLGHQKKMMLAIDRLKRLGSCGGKRQSNPDYSTPYNQHLYPTWSEARTSPQYSHEVAITTIKPRRPSSSDSSPTGSCRELSTFQQHNDVSTFKKAPSPFTYSLSESKTVRNDIDGKKRTPGTSDSVFVDADGSGTGKTQQNVVKQKPIARIVAKAKRTSRDDSPDYTKYKDFDKEGSSERSTPTNAVTTHKEMVKTLPEPVYDQPTTTHNGKPLIFPKPQYQTPIATAAITPLYIQTSQTSPVPNAPSPDLNKKHAPPPPPKRTHSIYKDPNLMDLKTEYMSNNSKDCNNIEYKLGLSTNNDLMDTVEYKPAYITSDNDPCLIDNMLGYMPTTKQPSPVTADNKPYHHTTHSPVVSKQPKSPSISSTSTPPPISTKPSFYQTNKTDTKLSHIATIDLTNTNNSNTNHIEQKQHESFANSLKSLSAKFGSAKVERTTRNKDMNDSCHSSDSEDFPPPPPPLAMDIITPNYSILSKGNREGNRESPERFTHPSRKQPFPTNPLLNLDRRDRSGSPSSRSPLTGSPASGSPVSCSPVSGSPSHTNNSRNESPVGFDLTGSTTSVDSNTLPFANENVGTIKQKALNCKPSIVELTETMNGERDVDVNTNFFEGRSSTLKRIPTSCESSSHSSANTRKLSLKETSTKKPNKPVKPVSANLQTPAFPTTIHTSLETENDDNAEVFDDIGNMLQGLTDELDAMLVDDL